MGPFYGLHLPSINGPMDPLLFAAKNMDEIIVNSPYSSGVGPELTDSEFKKLSTFVNSNYGIRLPDNKRVMVQSRLYKRIRALKMNSFKSYFEYVFNSDKGGEEIILMMDEITTNKTEFFRENVHFTYLQDTILPELSAAGKNKLNIWSAACSSGEEPYTIAMVMEEFAQKNKRLDYSILATDLSTRILKLAHNAIYSEQRVEIVPDDLKKKYLLKSKDPSKKLVRIIPELRRKMTFKRLNFMDENYQVNETYDIIFCRNVLIYFEREDQEKVINRLCRHLRPGGYFFLGHSESIMRMTVPLQQIKPTIFRRI